MHGHERLAMVNLLVLRIYCISCHPLACMHDAEVVDVIWIAVTNWTPTHAVDIIQTPDVFVRALFDPSLNCLDGV